MASSSGCGAEKGSTPVKLGRPHSALHGCDSGGRALYPNHLHTASIHGFCLHTDSRDDEETLTSKRYPVIQLGGRRWL